MSPLLFALTLLACIGLAGLGLSSLLIVNLHARNERRRQRLAAATAPHLPAGQEVLPSLFRRGGGRRRERLMRRAAGVVGFDPARHDHYPVPWWLVLGTATTLGRVASGALHELLGLFSILLVPAGAIIVSRAFFSWCDARRSRTLLAQMPDALAMIVRSVRVGIPIQEAIQAMAREAAQPTAQEFALLVNRVRIGVPLEEALGEMAVRNRMSEYRFFATALSLQSQTGGGLTETLESLADVIRKRVALRARGYALASEARTSAVILATLPVLSGLGLWFLNRSYMAKLFTDPAGQKIFGAAVLSLVFGLLVMRSIIQRSLS